MQPTDRGYLHVVPSNPAFGDDAAQRAPIEGLMLSLARLGIRVLALAAPTRAQRVRPLARALCASLAAADIKTVLVDLDPQPATTNAGPGWNPCMKLGPGDAFQDPEGFDVLTARPDAQTRALFNNLDHLKRALAEDLGGYKAVVINLAPILEPGHAAPNPSAVARAADGVLVVCGTNRTRATDAANGVIELSNAGCNVIGTVLDDSDSKKPGAEMANAVERSWLPPWAKQRLCDALRQNALLNS